MKKISIKEFKKICDSSDEYEYIFESDSQDWEDDSEMPSFRLVFSGASACWYPYMHTVRFFDDKNSFSLPRVREIYVEKEHPIFGIKYVITCESSVTNPQKKKYVIYAEKKLNKL